MTASAGVVYLAGFCTVDLAADEYTACTSRIDPSGDSVWEWRADDSINYWPMALAVAGDSLVTLASRFESMTKDGEPQILRFDLESGAPGPVTDLESLPELNLFAGLRGGDVVLTSVVDDKGPCSSGSATPRGRDVGRVDPNARPAGRRGVSALGPAARGQIHCTVVITGMWSLT